MIKIKILIVLPGVDDPMLLVYDPPYLVAILDGVVLDSGSDLATESDLLNVESY